jgi:hypothetical protein
MTNPDEDLLTTTEGVDEGSAASTAEGPDAERPAPPVDLTTEDSAAQRAPGQQLEAGEG